MTHNLDIFNFKKNKFWMFKLMGKYSINNKIFNVNGNHFFKLLGTGSKNGFNLIPDFSSYIILSSSENDQARKNLLSNVFYRDMINKCCTRKEITFEPYQSKGTWNNENPYKIVSEYKNKKILAITRARVRPSKIFNFLINTSVASKAIKDYEGVSYYKGVGEYPIIEPATVSIWDNEKAVFDFAYNDLNHKKIMIKSRENNWYSEEMFIRSNIINIKEFND